jgi:mxaJ protein
VGFPVMGDEPSAQRIVDALAAGTLDVAIIWSPQAGYFAGLRHLPLRIVPIAGGPRDPPLAFPIAMGVRPDDAALKRALDGALARVRPQIEAVLRDFAVTRADVASSSTSSR